MKLSQYESKASRLFLLHMPEPLGQPRPGSHTRIEFGFKQKDRSAWSNLRRDDLVLILSFAELKLFAVRVDQKSLRLRDTPISPHFPFVLLVDVLGCMELNKLPGELFFGPGNLFEFPRQLFQHYWENCEETSRSSSPYQREPIFSQSGFEVFIADTLDDFEFISGLATHHPFGERRAEFTLVAKKDGQLEGAILASSSVDSSVTHRAPWRLFRESYVQIRLDSLFVNRIYTMPRHWKTQAALLDALIHVAPSLVERDISILEGVSYDYHPLLIPRGFRMVLPRHQFESFYYWKPWFVPYRVVPPRSDSAEQRDRLKSFLSHRRAHSSWMVKVTERLLPLALEKRAWALRGNSKNRGVWRSVKKGDIVFLKSSDGRLLGYGIVDGTERRLTRGLEKFPLWIDFTDKITRCDIPIGQYVAEQWYQTLDRGGGIIPIPKEFAAQLQQRVHDTTKDRNMWVRPNPFLLRETEFEEDPKQVFMAQSWNLRESVLPVIKDILESSGYSLVYSGDRGGQVIFEDIWLMLNESAIVIVDFTHKRPNVYLEYGMALVLGKPIVAITQSKDDIPSDTPNLKYIVYNDALGDTNLSEKLPVAIRDTSADIYKTRPSSEVPS